MNLGWSRPAGRVGYLLLLLAIAVGCQQRNAFVAPPPPEVSVAQPVSQTVAETLEFTGNTPRSGHRGDTIAGHGIPPESCL